MNGSRFFLLGAGWLLGLLGLLLAAGTARADSVTLGTQEFVDGSFVTSSAFLNATASNPAPFNGFQGSGDSSSDFSASWTFLYPPEDIILLPTITIGILDNDAQAPGMQLASFTMANSDGTYDLTSALNTAFEAKGGANGQYDVYTAPIPLPAYPDLAGGSVTFSIALQGEGLDVLGTTAFNGAGLDFSTLELSTVPEPSSVACLLLAAGVGIAGWQRRRSAPAPR
jgi:hypothetical protein